MGILTLWELMWAVDVVGTDNDDWQLERLLVRVDQHLGSSLGGSVWVGWGQDGSLKEIIIILLDLTVDLISRDMDEALDASGLSALKENVSTVDISVGEAVRVAERQVDVGHGGEVEDGVDVVALDAGLDLLWVGDVALEEVEVLLLVQGAGVVQGGAVVELVKGDDVVGVWVLDSEVTDQPARAEDIVSWCCSRRGGVIEGGSHEASSTGNHDILDIWKRLKLGRADEDWSLLPDRIVLEERGILARCCWWSSSSACCSFVQNWPPPLLPAR
jgi:hypothetical protein